MSWVFDGVDFVVGGYQVVFGIVLADLQVWIELGYYCFELGCIVQYGGFVYDDVGFYEFVFWYQEVCVVVVVYIFGDGLVDVGIESCMQCGIERSERIVQIVGCDG